MLHSCLSHSCQQLRTCQFYNNHTKLLVQSKLSTKHKKTYVTRMSYDKNKKSRVGLIGLIVMGQNLALNITKRLRYFGV